MFNTASGISTSESVQGGYHCLDISKVEWTGFQKSVATWKARNSYDFTLKCLF